MGRSADAEPLDAGFVSMGLLKRIVKYVFAEELA
jgi:hypothetical protein